MIHPEWTATLGLSTSTPHCTHSSVPRTEGVPLPTGSPLPPARKHTHTHVHTHTHTHTTPRCHWATSLPPAYPEAARPGTIRAHSLSRGLALEALCSLSELRVPQLQSRGLTHTPWQRPVFSEHSGDICGCGCCAPVPTASHRAVATVTVDSEPKLL